VTHAEWGQGQVLSNDGEVIIVFFDTVGYKTLGLSLLADAAGVLRMDSPADAS